MLDWVRLGVARYHGATLNLTPMGLGSRPPVLNSLGLPVWPRLTVSVSGGYEAAVAPIDDVVKVTS